MFLLIWTSTILLEVCRHILFMRRKYEFFSVLGKIIFVLFLLSPQKIFWSLSIMCSFLVSLVIHTVPPSLLSSTPLSPAASSLRTKFVFFIFCHTRQRHRSQHHRHIPHRLPLFSHLTSLLLFRLHAGSVCRSRYHRSWSFVFPLSLHVLVPHRFLETRTTCVGVENTHRS